ncbi:MAG: ComF family protein [Planctomycetaceae bacterium]|nr:ComF family protein [Planctomycetaceae bacterium]
MSIAAGLSARIAHAAAAVTELVWPEVCAACAAAPCPNDALCDDCGRKLLGLIAVAYCPQCGASLGPNIPARDDGCWQCPQVLPRYSEVVRLGPYSGPLRDLVRQIKYRRRQRMTARLSEMLVQRLDIQCPQRAVDLVFPVPMHWRRRLWRGFDHARELAARLARRLDAAMGDELIRVRHTQPQTTLSRTARRRNMHGAFAMSGNASLDGACVLLVDDVTTTGATADEAARVLLSAGASAVILAVLAKAESQRNYEPAGEISPQSSQRSQSC